MLASDGFQNLINIPFPDQFASLKFHAIKFHLTSCSSMMMSYELQNLEAWIKKKCLQSNINM